MDWRGVTDVAARRRNRLSSGLSLVRALEAVDRLRGSGNEGFGGWLRSEGRTARSGDPVAAIVLSMGLDQAGSLQGSQLSCGGPLGHFLGQVLREGDNGGPRVVGHATQDHEAVVGKWVSHCTQDNNVNRRRCQHRGSKGLHGLCGIFHIFLLEDVRRRLRPWLYELRMDHRALGLVYKEVLQSLSVVS